MIDSAVLQELAKTPAGRRRIQQLQRQRENQIAAPAKTVAKSAGFKGPNRNKKLTVRLPVGRKIKRDSRGRFA